MQKNVKGIISLVIFIALIWFLFGGGLDDQVKSEMQRVENQVAIDAVAQYDIAKKNGSAMDAYVAAGFVSAAYLQAKDEENYKKWKAIETTEGKRAGISTE